MSDSDSKKYWDAVKETCPDAFLIFSRWIDEYKESVGWNFLFSSYKEGKETKSLIKFHDLPYEMQIGVLLRFFMETAHPDDNWFLPHLTEDSTMNDLGDPFDYFVVMQARFN